MLPFRLVSGSLIQVEGRLGNQKHLKLILDTGSSMIGERIAEKLKLDAHTAESFNFDQNLKWKTATRPEVQFGPVRAANVVVLVGDLVRYSEFAAKADAIIGMDLLNLRDVTIDFAAGRLIFEAAKVTAYVPGGDPMAKCLMVELRVQDRPVRLLIDTGLDEERLQQSVPGLRTAGSIKTPPWADACGSNKPCFQISSSANVVARFSSYCCRRPPQTHSRESTAS